MIGWDVWVKCLGANTTTTTTTTNKKEKKKKTEIIMMMIVAGLTVAVGFHLTEHGRTARPPRCAITRVLLRVVNSVGSED